MNRFFPFILLAVVSLCAEEKFTLKDGYLVKKEAPVVLEGGSHELYTSMLRAHEQKEWKKLGKLAQEMLENYGDSPFAKEANYFLGVSYFGLEDYELANQYITEYLTGQSSPRFIEEAIEYKYEVATKFRQGARKHVMGVKSMPKWSSAKSDALTIYDEVIAALPHHELSAHSLYGKGEIQIKNTDYRAAIETYQTLIRRFPKHPLAVESYIHIAQVYLMQSDAEYPDPDFLDLAELNLRKFSASFPTEEKIEVVENLLAELQNKYAGSLYETARFYERTKKWGAAKIYYLKIQKSYPRSDYAKLCIQRLELVENKIVRIEAKEK